MVETSTWLPGRKLLISPGVDRPVSRQCEMAHAAHFGYPYYWSGPLLWGAAAYPTTPVAAGTVGAMGPGRAAAERAAQEQLAPGDSHLRSGAELIGYQIEAKDGEIGEIEDFVIDERSWGISGVVKSRASTGTHARCACASRGSTSRRRDRSSMTAACLDLRRPL